MSTARRTLANRLAVHLRHRIGLSDGAAWRVYARYFRPRARGLAIYALIASAQSIMVLPALYLIRHAFDVAIPEKDIALLVEIGIGIVLIRAAVGGVIVAMRFHIVRIIKDAVRNLRYDLISRLYVLSRDFHARSDPARIQTRVVQETERVDKLSNTLFSSILPALLTGTALFACMLVLSWRLVLVMVCFAPVVWLVAGITGRQVRRRVRAFQNSFEAFSKGVSFVLHHVDLAFTQANEARETRRQADHLDDLARTGRTMALSYAVHGQIQKNVVGIAGILILVFGGAQVATGAMSLGDFMAFFLASTMLNSAINTALGGLPDVISGNESMSKLRALLETGPVQPYSGTRQIAFAGHIRLRGVSFDYGDAPVLCDVDLDIRPGARIAIVGPNGAGKSTIFHLIVGFYRPRSGELLADGVPYDETDMASLRRGIGIVMQRASFFNGTVVENIGYGCPDATMDEIVAAARLAGAHDFITALADGYDTEIGEGGIMLSGGECQRMAIARALLGRPKLLILDEPTNHLDAASVDGLMRALLTLPDRPAIILISHDMRVVGFAEDIYRLESGRLDAVENPSADAGAATVDA